ncbi:glycerate kinase [Paenibacillus aestuarii]|uniref:Glycerate kinase n=1 Tax=Paenibacillus aestuarii TaxID=516965 RepID=A0ABW0K730_9BACL|nr:glycerate kinase [Paenibacillus aestuarii]
MRILVAPDSYKGCRTASQVAALMKKGIESGYPEAIVETVPLADGGEGTLDTLVDATGGKVMEVEVTGPNMARVASKYGVLGDQQTAVIEVAQAAGLTLVPQSARNPLQATTLGVGELLIAALDEGYRQFIIGLGGSATNDGGLGMLQALGGVFADENGQQVLSIALSLASIRSVDLTGVDPRIKESQITVACDVDNPLCGPRGASAVFGPQKGASLEQVEVLDASLHAYASLIEHHTGRSAQSIPGAGAAGGLGFAFLMLGAELVPGAKIMAEASGLERKLRVADWVITGEGRSDSQTMYGKLPVYVAQQAKELGVKAILISGGLGQGYEDLYAYFVSCHSIVSGPMSLESAMEHAEVLLMRTSENVARLIQAASGNRREAECL